MAIPLPYASFDGIPAEAQRKIYRDLQALAQYPQPAFYDAIIDPTAPMDDPHKHVYRTLTALLVSETWATTHTFNVGVKQHIGVPISEPGGTVSIQGLGDLALFGMGPIQASNGGGGLNGIGWDWATISCDASQTVFYHNLVIDPGAITA